VEKREKERNDTKKEGFIILALSFSIFFSQIQNEAIILAPIFFLYFHQIKI